ncbi:TPA: homoserine kinase [Candidatus Avacholeplasma faecigallinarum]|nr:homoserine kinase [Candidatus Avacholeplasma faecigallinarum]
MLYVKVNATSANVCVGFDVLGLALNLNNTFSFEKSNEFSFWGFEDKYCFKETNLVYQAYVKVFEYTNTKPIAVKIGFSGEIPVSRGLGSSSSLIVAGVFAANYMLNNRLSKEDLFNICCKIEGHPDNVAPAIYGGLVASFLVGDKYKAISYEVNKDLKYIAIIPDTMVKTKDARMVLPDKLGYKDIVFNLSRIIHIPKAFKEGNILLLKELFIDKLHEPYRKKLISCYDSVKAVCENEDVAFMISGSGSTMLIICRDDKINNKLKQLNLNTKILDIGQGVEIWEG